MKRKREPYKKPAPNEKATIYPFNDNKQFDIETRRHQNLGHISPWKRIAGNKMINEDTGEIIDIKKKEKRNEKAVFRIQKMEYRDIKNNFNGKGNEYIIIVEFETTITDMKELKRLIKNFIEKLQRRLGDILFIRVLIYREPNQPIVHIWVKKIDNTKIELQQETLEELWSNGNIRAIEVTKRNIDRIAGYCFDRTIKKDLYPTGIKIYSTSKNIKKVQPVEVEYNQAEEIVKGCDLTYGGAVSFHEEIDNKDEELQYITYESYIKPEGLKLRKTPITTKYKGTIVKDYKKKQKEKADRNFEEIQKLVATDSCPLKVERLDVDLCKITVKSTSKEFKPLDTRQTIIFVRYLLNKEGGKENGRKE